MNEKKLDDNTPLYTISMIAKLLGVSVPTIRLYEKENLIIPFKKASKHRLYSNADIERLKFIRHTININKVGIAGLKIILSMIPCWDITNCSEETKFQCAAGNSLQPCWSTQNKLCDSKECRICDAYKKYNSCYKIKNGINEISGHK
jgi:MerR family transcriptional regulator, heat shock protein HspR